MNRLPSIIRRWFALDISTCDVGPRWIRRVPFTLAMLGMILVGSSVLVGWNPKRQASPGHLVPSERVQPRRTLSAINAVAHTEPSARFELRNVGGQPVRILEIISGCGCARPTVTPMIISPGRTGIVDVEATPIVTGEKEVIITLITDSPTSPEIDLRFLLVGDVPPPYLLGATGDLAFVAGSGDVDARTIRVILIEKAGSRLTPPIVKTDVPGFELGQPLLEKEQPYLGEGNVSRTYKIETKLTTNPDGPTLVGDVSVIDPWNAQRVQTLRVHVDYPPLLKASPSRVIFRINGIDSKSVDAAQVIIVARELVPDIVAEVEDLKSPLILSQIRTLDSGRMCLLTIGIKPGTTQSGEYVVRVGRKSSTKRLSIPVAILIEEQR